MREIVIISGKGGTGKTSLTAAFAHLAGGNKILCDLDVDTPDLHILLRPRHELAMEFRAGNEARIEQAGCTDCGLCVEMCRFHAVHREQDGLSVDPIRCEGCKVCVVFCPEQAISFPEKHCGTWYISATRFGTMVHAQLFPGEENSGRLVSLLKTKAREIARQKGIDLILSDGAPGVGCPVISSLSGAHCAVLVTEPTPSGRHDLERVAALCDHFRIRAGIIINKADLNPGQAEIIEAYCRRKGYPLLAKLPYDSVITEAMITAKAVTELGETAIGDAIRQAWDKIKEFAGQEILEHTSFQPRT